MLKCIAIDDEVLALELMTDYISKVPYLKLVAVCDDPLEAIGLIEEHHVDLVILDIQMPGINGLQLIQSLSRKPLFILITAYERYALEAYNLNAVDYLVKPVPFDRFLKATNRANELYQLRNNAAGPAKEEQNHIFIYVDSTYIKVYYDDILWVEGLKDYIRIHLKNTSKALVARVSMKSIEDQLPSARFIRIQKSYIVSRESISAVRKNSVFIGPKELPVGDIYKEAVQALVGKSPE